MFLIKDDFWQVKKTKEKGFGIFAKKEIKKGTVIGDYLGKVIETARYDFDNDKNGLYLMYYTDKASIYPDLKKPGIHLLNHSCAPNCWIYAYQYHTLFFALRNIKPSEELTISYLLSPKGKSCNPRLPSASPLGDGGQACKHICKCASKSCTGTMHLSEDKYRKWQKFQNSQKTNVKRPFVIFNKNLPKLASYPKTVPTNPIIISLY